MSIKLKGMERINANLKRLERGARADLLIGTLERSAEPFERHYANGAHEEIRPGVKTRMISRSPRETRVAVGSRHPLAHIFEFGTRQRYRKTADGEARTGKITKMGFARRAFDVNVRPWFRNVSRMLFADLRRMVR